MWTKTNGRTLMQFKKIKFSWEETRFNLCLKVITLIRIVQAASQMDLLLIIMALQSLVPIRIREVTYKIAQAKIWLMKKILIYHKKMLMSMWMPIEWIKPLKIHCNVLENEKDIRFLYSLEYSLLTIRDFSLIINKIINYFNNYI
jgi:hypothetical protein